MKELRVYSTPTCSVCVANKEDVDAIVKASGVDVYNIDATTCNTEELDNYKVQSVPTYIVTENGETILKTNKISELKTLLEV